MEVSVHPITSARLARRTCNLFYGNKLFDLSVCTFNHNKASNYVLDDLSILVLFSVWYFQWRWFHIFHLNSPLTIMVLCETSAFPITKRIILFVIGKAPSYDDRKEYSSKSKVFVCVDIAGDKIHSFLITD